MSILHLIVRRHTTTRAPDRRAQRGCTVPPLLREAAADIVCTPGIGIHADGPQRHGPAASDREQATATVGGGRRVRP